MTPSRRGPLPLSGRATLAAGLTATALTLSGCTSVPDEVDEFARGYGVEINPDRTEITDLAVGDCFHGFEDEGNAVTTVECAEEHDSELIHVVTVPESVAEFPGGDTEPVWFEHEEACYGQAFEDYVGEPWEISDWDVYTFRPTEWGWADGDRTIQCVLYNLQGEYWTGSPSTGDAVVIPADGSDGFPPGDPGDPGESPDESIEETSGDTASVEESATGPDIVDFGYVEG